MALGTITVCLAALPACSHSDGGGGNPYAAQIRAAQRQATSGFERQVLSDGKITRAEYQEAVMRYVACAATKGLVITPQLTSGGVYQYGTAGQLTSAQDQIMTQCSKGTTILIEPLFVDLTQNPHDLTGPELLFNCLKRKGVAVHGLSAQGLGQLLKQYNDPSQLPSSGPINGQDPRVQACFSDPYD